MDSNNFTPLPDSLKQELTPGTHPKLHKFKLSDVALVASFVLFVLSVGYWVQSTMLQPSTSATQKIIEATPTPSPTPTVAVDEIEE